MMNLKEYVLNLSKIFIISCLLLSGCVFSYSHHLDFFYASTCPRCKLFKEDVIPYLKKEYHSLKITLHDIDEEESIDLYVKTLSLLDGYKVNDDTGEVPFIVFDGNFVKFGYNDDEKELLLENIDRAMNDEKIQLSTDYYLFSENKTLY